MSELATYGAASRASHTNLLGVGFDAGTVRATAIAAGIVVIAGLLARRRVTSRVPGRLQLAAETLIDLVERQLPPSLGRRRAVVPLALSLFAFILVANTLRAIPGTSKLLPTPTADLNLTVALAVVVIVTVHTASIRARGLGGYLHHYVEPYWWLAPINILEELVRPLTLALRLFGTAFAGGLMLALIGELIPAGAAPLPHVVWALFDLAVGVMQAFIFALLTVIYYRSAVTTDVEQPAPSAVAVS
jgi:F-type H+-transporting ATPase subunit a